MAAWWKKPAPASPTPAEARPLRLGKQELDYRCVLIRAMAMSATLKAKERKPGAVKALEELRREANELINLIIETGKP